MCPPLRLLLIRSSGMRWLSQEMRINLWKNQSKNECVSIIEEMVEKAMRCAWFFPSSLCAVFLAVQRIQLPPAKQPRRRTPMCENGLARASDS